MSNKPEAAVVSMSAADLDRIISNAVAAAVEAARKPVITDKELREQEQAQQERIANSAEVKRKIELDRVMRKNCTHLRRDGTVRAVYVKGLNLMHCQMCQAFIRPGERPKDNPFPEHFYDTEMFNRLFALSGIADMIE